MGVDTGPSPPSEGPTVGAYLAEWIAHMRGRLRPKTPAGYECLIRLHAEPAIGDSRLSDLGPMDEAPNLCACDTLGGPGSPSEHNTDALDAWVS